MNRWIPTGKKTNNYKLSWERSHIPSKPSRCWRWCSFSQRLGCLWSFPARVTWKRYPTWGEGNKNPSSTPKSPNWCIGYSPKNEHGTRKTALWRGKSSSKPPFLRFHVNFQRCILGSLQQVVSHGPQKMDSRHLPNLQTLKDLPFAPWCRYMPSSSSPMDPLVIRDIPPPNIGHRKRTG